MSTGESLKEASPASRVEGTSGTTQSLKRRALGNALWNWLGVGVDTGSAILLTPFLIRSLGDSVYGTWIIIGSLTGYLGVLDLGLRSAVGRSVAYHLAKRDDMRVSQIANTAAAAMAAIGLLGFLLVIGLSQILESMTKIPEEQMHEARLALVIVGFNLAIWFPIQVLDGVLYGYERFDLFNMVYTPTMVVRAALSGAVVWLGYGLIGLAWATVAVTLASGMGKFWMCRVTDHKLRLDPGQVRYSALLEMWGFGFWNFVTSIGNMARTQLSSVVVGASLGAVLATPFSVIARLLGTANIIVIAGIGALAPHATALHSLGDHERQRRLFVETGKFCVAGSLIFFSLFLLLGDALLSLWIRPEMAWVWKPLMIAACGELIPMAVVMSNNTIHGMAQNRPMAFRGIAECVTAVLLAWAVGNQYGLNGICAALAISATVWRGVFTLLHALRLIELPITEFLQESVAPMVMAVVPAIALVWTLISMSPATTWFHLIVYGNLFVFLASLLAITVSLGPAYVVMQIRARVGARLSPTSDKS